MQPLIGLHTSRHSFSPWISPDWSVSSRTSPTLIPPPCKPLNAASPFSRIFIVWNYLARNSSQAVRSCFTTPEPCPVGHWENPSLDSPGSQKHPSTIMFIWRGELHPVQAGISNRLNIWDISLTESTHAPLLSLSFPSTPKIFPVCTKILLFIGQVELNLTQSIQFLP